MPENRPATTKRAATPASGGRNAATAPMQRATITMQVAANASCRRRIRVRDPAARKDPDRRREEVGGEHRGRRGDGRVVEDVEDRHAERVDAVAGDRYPEEEQRAEQDGGAQEKPDAGRAGRRGPGSSVRPPRPFLQHAAR